MLVTKALMEPSELAGTMAALATMLASRSLRVETNGWAPPAGNRVRYPNREGGTTVAFTV